MQSAEIVFNVWSLIQLLQNASQQINSSATYRRQFINVNENEFRSNQIERFISNIVV